MKNKWKVLFVLLVACVFSFQVSGQVEAPQETRNAALRYWMAFARLQDVSVDAKTKDLLEKALAEPTAWDDNRLGPIVDENMEAIATMQRATKLPDCDWGLEYSRGPRMQLQIDGHAARALARLNILYGMRSVAKGDSQKAADTWIAGIRFSQDIARGGSLLATLVGNSVLLQDLRAVTQATEKGAFNAEQKRQLAIAVKALPETGFDWAQAFWYESFALGVVLREMREAKDPAAYYMEIMGEPAPANWTPPTAAETAAFHKLMVSVQGALRLNPSEAKEKLKNLQSSVSSLNPFFREATPSFEKTNAARIELQSMRETTLRALAASVGK